VAVKAVAVKDGTKPSPKAACSVLDSREHGATIERAGFRGNRICPRGEPVVGF
jgi:hypothetical protein